MVKTYTWIQPMITEENGLKYYHTLEITIDDTISQPYQVGDTVLLQGDDEPFIAEIHSMYEKKNGKKFITCQWYYRPDDVRTLAKQDILKDIDLTGPIVFSSIHNDEIEVETILRPCSVVFETAEGDKWDHLSPQKAHGNDAFICR
jgi:hypothetical protein